LGDGHDDRSANETAVSGRCAVTAAELQQLRDVLALRRLGLVDRLATDTSGTLDQAFVSLLADTHTAIAAIDAEIAESITAGDSP
jgi:hypothetical protein